MSLSTKLVTNKILDSFYRKGLLRTLKSCAAELKEIRFDRKFGTDTLESDSDYANVHGPEVTGYSPTKIRTLRKIFDELPVRYEDFLFLDAGSGKGRALLAASEYPFRRILGIELAPGLHWIAKKNIQAYRSNTQKCGAIESHCCDVTGYPLPDEDTVLFLFNPFTSPVISRLLASLRQSLETHPRKVYLVYNNPVCHDLVVQAGFLKVVRMNELYAIYQSKAATAETLDEALTGS